MIDVETVWHEVFAKVNMVVIVHDVQVVATTQVLSKGDWSGRDLRFSSSASMLISLSILVKYAQQSGVKVMFLFGSALDVKDVTSPSSTTASLFCQKPSAKDEWLVELTVSLSDPKPTFLHLFHCSGFHSADTSASDHQRRHRRRCHRHCLVLNRHWTSGWLLL